MSRTWTYIGNISDGAEARVVAAVEVDPTGRARLLCRNRLWIASSSQISISTMRHRPSVLDVPQSLDERSHVIREALRVLPSRRVADAGIGDQRCAREATQQLLLHLTSHQTIGVPPDQ